MDGNRKSAMMIAMSIVKNDISNREKRSELGNRNARTSKWLELLTSPLFLLPFFLVGLVVSILGEFAFDIFLLKMTGRTMIVAVMSLVVINNIVEIYWNRQNPE